VVTFRSRLNGEGVGDEPTPQGRLCLSIEECIRRYLVHVPPPDNLVVRAYGLYAPTKREPWSAVGSSWGKGRSQSQGGWTGRRRAVSEAMLIPNVVRAAVAFWSAGV